ncbi:MAG: serine protease [Nitrospirota bacterium]|jgi:S1-C subfamily serine protease
MALAVSLLFPALAATAGPLAETIDHLRTSVVGVGTWKLRRTPPSHYMGTGFVVADGRHCLTNAHVVAPFLSGKAGEDVLLKVYALGDPEPTMRGARVVTQDPDHDLALLAFDGPTLPAFPLGDSHAVREGDPVAFTGFPIGMVLGLHPATHRGTVAAIVPVADPALSSRHLDAKRIKRLRHPFDIFQLDATAYPGNSGSPVYRPESGEVVAVINSVFIKGTKENVLKNPSGISYAIPIHLAKPLLAKIK